ncbi:MAG: caspase family protein [Hyphomicrobiales bacterium]|nr:caspase family protein [Hyphomicrobiales bacterium]
MASREDGVQGRLITWVGVLTAAVVTASSPPALGATESPGVVIRAKSGQQVTLYKGSYALVIGVSEYVRGWPRLNGVKEDVPAVTAALERQGFQVTVASDPTRDEMDRAFRTFIAKYGRDEDNRLLFYFAGHGHTVERGYGAVMGYLVGREAANPNVDESAFLEGALSMQNIEVYARSIDAKHALFLLDACFAGSVFDATRAIPHVIREKTGWPVRQFITSGTAEQEVPDRSIFRDLFIRALDGEGDLDGDGYLTGTELGHYLETNVTNYSRRAQTPQYGKLRDPLLDRGDFVFVTGKAAPPLAKAPAAASAPAATDRETVFWQSVRDSDNPALYRAYLEQYPAGVYAPIARVRLHALESIHPGTPEAPQAVEAATRTSTDSTRIPPSPKAATKETGGAATGDAARPTPSIKPLLEKLATLSGDARVSRLSEIVPGMGPGLTASDVAALLGNLTGSHRGQALQVLDPVIPNSLKPSEFSMLAGNVDTRIRYELLRSMRSKIGAPLTADGIVELYGPAVGGWRLDFLNLFAGHLPDRLSIEGVTTLVETTDIRVRYDMLKVLAPQLPRTLGRKDLLTLWGRDATGGWRRDFLNLFAGHLPDRLSIEDITTLVETTDVRVRYDITRTLAGRLPKTLSVADVEALIGPATGGWRLSFLRDLAQKISPPPTQNGIETLLASLSGRERTAAQELFRTSAK